ELPCWPRGSPTASPLAATSVFGHRRISASISGVRASPMALPTLLELNPHPSSTMRTNGRSPLIATRSSIPATSGDPRARRGRRRDRGELGCAETRAADERAVEVPLCEERRGVLHRDASPVQHARARCAPSLHEARLDVRAHLLGLVWRRRATRSDGPHGLVRDDEDVRVWRRAERLERSVELAIDDRRRLPAVTLGLGLADRNDHGQAGGDRGGELATHLRVGLAASLPPLRVTDECEVTPTGDHEWRDLAGICAGGLPEHVLCPQLHVASAQQVPQRPQMCERWQHHDLHTTDVAGGVTHIRGQPETLFDGGVHLPVAAHQWRPVGGAAGGCCAHRRAASRSRSAATPGKALPSRNSMVAPPPVLMWPILSATPASSTAAARSPPPITVYARDRDRAPATARVPAA